MYPHTPPAHRHGRMSPPTSAKPSMQSHTLDSHPAHGLQPISPLTSNESLHGFTGMFPQSTMSQNQGQMAVYVDALQVASPQSMMSSPYPQPVQQSIPEPDPEYLEWLREKHLQKLRPQNHTQASQTQTNMPTPEQHHPQSWDHSQQQTPSRQQSLPQHQRLSQQTSPQQEQYHQPQRQYSERHQGSPYQKPRPPQQQYSDHQHYSQQQPPSREQSPPQHQNLPPQQPSAKQPQDYSQGQFSQPQHSPPPQQFSPHQEFPPPQRTYSEQQHYPQEHYQQDQRRPATHSPLHYSSLPMPLVQQMQHRGLTGYSSRTISMDDSYRGYAANFMQQQQQQQPYVHAIKPGHTYGKVTIKGNGKILMGNGIGSRSNGQERQHNFGDVEAEDQASVHQGDVPVEEVTRFFARSPTN